MAELNREPNKEETATATVIGEKKTKLRMKIDKKKFTFFVIALVLLLMAFNVGKHSAIDEEVVKARIEADTMYQEKIGQLDDAKSELVTVKTEIKKNQAMIDDAQKYFDEKEKNDSDLEKLKEEVESLEGDISSGKAQLEKLTGDIIKAKGNPVKLSAGHFTVGKDIATGRYKVTGDSNFVVYDGFGSLKVNTILGGKYGVESYVCELGLGDTLKCSGSDTFTPIE